MASFDYDALIVRSGFGGNVSALRAAEKGYRVGVLGSGRGRRRDPEEPVAPAWLLVVPAAGPYRIQRVEYSDSSIASDSAHNPSEPQTPDR